MVIYHGQTTIQAAQRQQQQQQKEQQEQQNQINTFIGSKRPLPIANHQARNRLPQPTPSSPRSTPAFQRPILASHNRSSAPRLVASPIDHINPESSRLQVSEYTQRKVFSATPTSTVDRSLSLSFPRYDLPDQLVANFAALGIKEIYPWQKHCLMGPGLLDGSKNLIYTAPTGGGKSLVADVLMLKRVLEQKDAKALLVLPYVALVQEKVRWLRNVVQGLSRSKPQNTEQKEESNGLWQRRADQDTIRAVGFFGGEKVRASWTDFDIGVCTFEKANTLINTAIDECSISALRAVVLDELHMIDDDHRGYLLEIMATKVMCLDQGIQMIGMSATLSDINVLATWLGAHRYETLYRPVPIEEHLVYECKTYPAATTGAFLNAASQLSNQTAPTTQIKDDEMALRVIQPSSHKELKDRVLNAVVALASETFRSGYGVLVFCSSRVGCESDAKIISRALPGLEEIDPGIIDRRLDLLGDLRSLPSGLDPVLAETVSYGVAFHHAGLTTEERDLITSAYDRGVIRVVVATCSLAAGINLPARRVVLHGARMGRDLVGPSMLRQMRGRAGRKGKDEVGETYLCCRKDDLKEVVQLMNADLPQVSSGLTTEKHRVQRALLEAIAVKLATGRESINDFVEKTLMRHTCDPKALQEHVESSLENLRRMGFIENDEQSSEDDFRVTLLGRAVVSSSMEPEDGVFIHRELQRALRAFVMDGDMHILYTLTPVNNQGVVINWKVFRNEMEGLDGSAQRVLSFLGLKPALINRMAQGDTLKESTSEEKELARIYRRFYLALQLRDLCDEVPVHVVARRYDVPRGSVQTLAQTCEGFAAGMIKFCETMGWGMMAAMLNHVADRLKAGARSDLLALSKITFIKSRTARVFYDNGYKTAASIANADPQELVPVLMQAQPAKLRLKSSKDEHKYAEKLLAKAQVISESANRLWQIEMQNELMEEE